MKGLQTLGIILGYCGFVLSAPICDYKLIENKYVCLMSGSSSNGLINGTHIQDKEETDVYRVTTTDEANQKLISAVLTNFQNLAIFEVPKGKIDSIVVGDFTNCTENLVELQISNGDLEDIPEKVFDNCTSLESIDFTGNKLSKAKTGSFPGILKKLNLANNKIEMDNQKSTIFADNQNLKDLTHLDLSGNGIETLSNSVLPTKNLIHLDLSNNKLEEISETYFNENVNLEILNLQNNQLTSISNTIFEKLENLKELRIGSNNINSIHTSAFQNNKLMEHLDMSSNEIVLLNANLLKNLTALKVLNLQDTKLNTSNLEPLKTILLALTNLEELDISRNVIGPIDGLFTKNDKLLKLNINSMELTEFKEDIFSALTKLQTLNFDENKISEFPDKIFEKTTEITTISARGNKLVKLKASTFEKMENLITLDFTGNKIDAIESTFFDKLKKLKVVRFGSENNCIKKDFEDFTLNDDLRVEFHKCFDNFNSARSIVISNVLLAFVLAFKFI